jgi:predicted nucleic acid-binding protein
VLYALDTNVYITALRDPRGATVYDGILANVGRALRLPAVVAMELRCGARTDAQRDSLAVIINAYKKRDRIFAPSPTAFLEAGRVVADLAARERYAIGDGTALLNDALIAASCREGNITLVSGNYKHFDFIRKHLRGFRYVGPDQLI